MSTQLVLSLSDTAHSGGSFRWCWLGAEGPSNSGSGNREQLREALAATGAGLGNRIATWLVLPGARVVTRALSYSDKEKKHLRSLLPYQLEDALVGDVDEFHFAFSAPIKGSVALAYADRSWLQELFSELASLGLEITRCWSAPLTLPLVDSQALNNGAPDQAIAEHWTLGVYQGQLWLRKNAEQGWSYPIAQARLALQLLASELAGEALPALHLRAASEADLAQFDALLPDVLQSQVASRALIDDWNLNYQQAGIDLCQGEFSQRLPFARWWSLWKALAIFAAVCLVLFVATSLLEIRKLGKENLQIRQQIEQTAREVLQGRMLDAERQLGGMLRQMEPAQAGGNLMPLLAKVLPAATEVQGVTIKGVAYNAETGELNLNIEADSFSKFEELSSKIETRGLNAELLSANVQGNIQTARLKVSRSASGQ